MDNFNFGKHLCWKFECGRINAVYCSIEARLIWRCLQRYPCLINMIEDIKTDEDLRRLQSKEPKFMNESKNQAIAKLL